VTIRYYTAIADPEPGTGLWSILFPDFPGVTSVAERFAEVPQQARDALATVVEDMIVEGEDLPPSSEEGAFVRVSAAEFHDPHYVLVPVEVPENPVRINVSIDRGLLKRIDDAAKRRGMTRSGFLAEGARQLLRAAANRDHARTA
jgi:predicted RNase H-like HicB family nuclease